MYPHHPSYITAEPMYPHHPSYTTHARSRTHFTSYLPTVYSTHKSSIAAKVFISQPEDGQCKGPKPVVVLYLVNSAHIFVIIQFCQTSTYTPNQFTSNSNVMFLVKFFLLPLRARAICVMHSYHYPIQFSIFTKVKRTEIGLTPFPLLPTLKPLGCIVNLTKNHDKLLKTNILQKAKELNAI